MTDIALRRSDGFFARASVWAKRVALGGKLMIGLVAGALVSGVATYLALSTAVLPSADPRTVNVLMLVNLVLLLSLVALISWRLVRLWIARRSGSAGSRLHARMVGLFSAVAVIPTIIVAIFSFLFFDVGLQSWFNDRVRTVLSNSLSVAEAYAEEHRKVIHADILTMANDLNQQAFLLSGNNDYMSEIVSEQAAVRSLAEAIVFDGTGRVLARANLSFSLDLDRLPTQALREAANGQIVFLTGRDDDRIRALVRLDRFVDTYLYVSRFVDSRVLSRVEKARQGVTGYDELEQARFGIQTKFHLIFLALAVLVLLAAVAIGLWLATRIAEPIGGLARAAESIRRGDLSARVDEPASKDEIGTLSRVFNRMTEQLQSQRNELIDANQQLDIRRRFIETVLSGVTAGVLGLDPDGVITLPNRSAALLLGENDEELVGRRFVDVAPELEGLLDEVAKKPDRVAEAQVSIVRDGRRRILLARVSAESVDGEIRGYVVTFDDISNLVAAQRTAAWADVARRIAHEIKNPLTPIQLSAERLHRKYEKEITSDRTVFDRCTDTIIRQVGDIRRMVDEFSAFARMPAPEFAQADLVDLVRQAIFLQEVAHPEIRFDLETPRDNVIVWCDARQVSQALTNVLKNACEGITEKKKNANGEEGRISVTLNETVEQIVLDVEDNGCGLPAELKDKITEPYVTTRVKGSGLGLAIVKKVMEDHGGELTLDDREGGGVRVRLAFRIQEEQRVSAQETGGATDFRAETLASHS